MVRTSPAVSGSDGSLSSAWRVEAQVRAESSPAPERFSTEAKALGLSWARSGSPKPR